MPLQKSFPLHAAPATLNPINSMAVVCFIIHGIGEQDQKFSLPLREGIHKQLQKLPGGKEAKVEFYDLYWANEGSDFQDNLYRSVYPDLYAPGGLLKRSWQTIRNLGPLRALTFRLIGDVFGYLGRFQKPIKTAVIRQMARVLKEKQEEQEPFSVILVGHSLGSVILHDLISSFVQYRYAAFETMVGSTSVFTMGSPLSLFSLVAETANPKRFRKWTNFLHAQDPIAFPMTNRFPTVKDVVIDEVSANPLKTHGTYWSHSEVHKQIAAEIVEHQQGKLAKVIPDQHLPAVPPEIYQPFNATGTKSGFSEYLSNFDKVPFEELFSSAMRVDACLLYG
ncbi:MAG: lipase family protein, partial [Limisphaerales bacterium]